MGAVIKLSELNEFICCPVCHGYLIDATTISECLHTFCKSCIVKHIKNDHNECPKCKTIIHERRPLDYIMYDHNKQDIVYKLVPQLYISELDQRIGARELSGIDDISSTNVRDKIIEISIGPKVKNPINPYILPPEARARTRYLFFKCPITVRIGHLKKLVRLRYQLESNDKITLFYKGDIVSDDDLVSNLAQSLTFCLHFEISKLSDSRKESKNPLN